MELANAGGRGYSVASIALTLSFRATGRKLKPSFIASFFCIPCKNEKQFNSIMSVAEAEGVIHMSPYCALTLSSIATCRNLNPSYTTSFFCILCKNQKQGNLIMVLADVEGGGSCGRVHMVHMVRLSLMQGSIDFKNGILNFAGKLAP